MGLPHRPSAAGVQTDLRACDAASGAVYHGHHIVILGNLIFSYRGNEGSFPYVQEMREMSYASVQ
jgi:hypothetical protein